MPAELESSAKRDETALIAEEQFVSPEKTVAQERADQIAQATENEVPVDHKVNLPPRSPSPAIPAYRRQWDDEARQAAFSRFRAGP